MKLSKLLVPMQVKADKWTKLASQEDNVVMIKDFLEKRDCRLLTVVLTSTGQLVPSTNVGYIIL